MELPPQKVIIFTKLFFKITKNYFLGEIFVSEDFVIVENRTTFSCFAISLCTEDAILVDISLTSR